METEAEADGAAMGGFGKKGYATSYAHKGYAKKGTR
jgi:hypothetical protein